MIKDDRICNVTASGRLCVPVPCIAFSSCVAPKVSNVVAMSHDKVPISNFNLCFFSPASYTWSFVVMWVLTLRLVALL